MMAARSQSCRQHCLFEREHRRALETGLRVKTRKTCLKASDLFDERKHELRNAYSWRRPNVGSVCEEEGCVGDFLLLLRGGR